MKEILLTSSALILALLVLRRLFRNSVSRRVQYALWGLVLLRLLVPVSLPSADFSLLTAADPMVQDMEALYLTPYAETITAPGGTAQPYPYVASHQAALGPATQNNIRVYTDRYGVSHETEYRQQISLNGLLRPIWYTGMAVMACWLLLGNLAFWRKLRKNRQYFAVKDCKYPVYLVETGLPSPCLFGLFRPAIYLTPAAVRNPDSLRHVLAHEETHAQHWDPLWSMLRGVCLAVYWFNPLVWWAALASRTDCELACDEGALRRLGEEQRIPYGQTLLSLIPVAKEPRNPLLAATTMTAGKRQLKDRITRIAENRRTVGAALFAVAALAALACAVTFTGGAAAGPQPLTKEELTWFSWEFFNGKDFNIRNQFLSSTYEGPEDIDLSALFYCGTGRPVEVAEEERQAAAQAALGFDPEVDLTKCPAADMDAVLEEHAGLTLAETRGLHLDAFTYLPDYDAYYFFHGDTNYRDSITITSGEREGDLVRLYYRCVDDFYTDGQKCVTLRETAKGDYQFVSNLPLNTPLYPAEQLTIPLEGLEPYEPQPAELLPFPEGNVYLQNTFNPEQSGATTALSPYCMMFFTAESSTFIGIQNSARSSWPQPILEYTGDSVSGYFQNFLGHDGFNISYTSQEGEALTDYYYVAEDETVMLLARLGSGFKALDLDGDGQKEVVSGDGAQLVFQRDGKLYHVDIKAVLEENWPMAADISFGGWDAAGRCLTLSAQNAYAALDSSAKYLEGVEARIFRTLYFDGENLLLCSDPRTPEDHMMDSTGVPSDIEEAAQNLARETMQRRLMEDGPSYDNWRIGTLTGPFFDTICGQGYEIWQMDFELHTSTPDLVYTLGSAYMDENGWCGSGRPAYLVFQNDNIDSAREYLYAIAESDVAPGSAFFQASMIEQLVEIGELTYSELDGEALYSMLLNHPGQLMEALGALPAGQRDAALETLAVRLTAGASGTSAWNAVRNLMQTAQLTTDGAETWDRLQKLVSAVPTAAGVDRAA